MKIIDFLISEFEENDDTIRIEDDLFILEQYYLQSEITSCEYKVYKKEIEENGEFLIELFVIDEINLDLYEEITGED